MDAQELQKLDIAGIYHTSTGQTLRKQDVPEVTKFAEAVIKAWAERAVSPAESVQSIDTPELAEILGHIVDEAVEEAQPYPKYAAEVIAHIDASRAAAHAEGRRSAMEELHPQWLKEKERADKADADAAMWAKRYSDALNAAARQAPDWTDKQIMALWTQCNMPSEENDFITGPLPFARALLSSTAQPLQQEGGFDFRAHLARQAKFSAETFGPGMRTAGVCDHIRKELKEIEADPTDLAEWIDVVILALDGAWRCGGSPSQIIDGIVAKQTKNEGRKWPDWRTADPNKAIEHDRTADSPQPSDNLQQASTAQVDPARMECPTCGVDRFKKPCPNMADECPMFADAHLLKPADSATDAGLRLRGKASPEFLAEFAAAQATPEGAELPNWDEKFEEAWPRIHAHGVENGWRGIALAAWKERGALAATTTAEPVGKVLRNLDGYWYFQPWVSWDEIGDGTKLYRAEPPQQVADPATPEGYVRSYEGDLIPVGKDGNA